MVADYERNASRQFSRYVPSSRSYKQWLYFEAKMAMRCTASESEFAIASSIVPRAVQIARRFPLEGSESIQFPFHAHQEQSGLGINMIVA